MSEAIQPQEEVEEEPTPKWEWVCINILKFLGYCIGIFGLLAVIVFIGKCILFLFGVPFGWLPE
jgi:hypothetical protein